jgi:outer membrane protein TolC
VEILTVEYCGRFDPFRNPTYLLPAMQQLSAPRFAHKTRPGYALLSLCGMAVLAGCSSPLAVQGERELKKSVMDSVRRELTEAQKNPVEQTTTREPGVERLKIKPELMPELERMSGPQSYDRNAYVMDQDLLGRAQKKLPLTLEQAIRSAATNNLQIEFARLQPAIAESQVVAAQAAFDSVLFNNFEWSNLDQPRVRTTQGFQTFGVGNDQRQAVNNGTGIRRPLTSGGQVIFQQDLLYSDVSTTGQGQVPNPANEVDWTLRLEQPLLRNFGTDVNLAQVRLNQNAERDSVASLKRDLIKTVTDTEKAYWQLAQARYDLLILQRLYERGVQVRDELDARIDIVRDISTAQIADARARVERRRADVMRAQQVFRRASDELKVLINDPRLPVGGEELIDPVDNPADAPISFSLADIMTNAIRNRPEAQQAILSIDNTSIRQVVADNQRLPKLDLRLQTRFAGLDDNYGDAYSDIADTQFVDYLAGVQFEQPIGNRQAEEQYRQRRLERMQATISYRFTVQQIVLEAKKALREVVLNYKLIEQTRVARVAQAENLRSFEVERRILKGDTYEQRDLEFRNQESLAQSEQQEIAARADYAIAIADLYAAMGTALERNNIEFRVPDADESFEAGGVNSKNNPVVPIKEKPTYIAPRGTPYQWPWKNEPPTK